MGAIAKRNADAAAILGKRAALLQRLLREARQYVADAGSDEDPETQNKSAELLAEIDAAIR